MHKVPPVQRAGSTDKQQRCEDANTGVVTNESLTDQRFRVKQVISHMQVRKRAIPTSCDYAREVGLSAIYAAQSADCRAVTHIFP